MELLIDLLSAADALSPIGVIGLCVALITYLVKQHIKPAEEKVDLPALAAKLHKIETNDLHELPEMAETLRQILSTLQRMEVDQGKEFAHIKARLNGKH